MAREERFCRSAEQAIETISGYLQRNPGMRLRVEFIRNRKDNRYFKVYAPWMGETSCCVIDITWHIARALNCSLYGGSGVKVVAASNKEAWEELVASLKYRLDLADLLCDGM